MTKPNDKETRTIDQCLDQLTAKHAQSIANLEKQWQA
jgi:hypothetical protein